MARYIIIDRYSDYIFADTADLDGAARDETPIEACQRLDAWVGEDPTEFEYSEQPISETAYEVYRADLHGSEVVPVIQDGQDHETIAAVKTHCAFLTTVYRRWADHWRKHP